MFLFYSIIISIIVIDLIINEKYKAADRDVYLNSKYFVSTVIITSKVSDHQTISKYSVYRPITNLYASD